MQKIVLKNSCFLCFAVKEQIYWHYFGEHIFHLMTEIFFSRKLAPAKKNLFRTLSTPLPILPEKSHSSPEKSRFCEVKNITFFFLFRVIFHVDNNHNTLHY